MIDSLYQARRRVVEATLSAHQTARDAILSAGETFIHGGGESFQAVNRAERELDRLDREIDDSIADVISYTAPHETRELLACLKCMVDLERIGDLAQDFATRARLVSSRLAIEDTQLLLKMCAEVESMLRQSATAFANQSVEAAFDVIRADTQVDQLRNIVIMRHTDEMKSCDTQESFHVVAMAQALERAGDHAKNLAEEVCHLVNGHSVRHSQTRRMNAAMHQERLFQHPPAPPTE